MFKTVFTLFRGGIAVAGEELEDRLEGISPGVEVKAAA